MENHWKVSKWLPDRAWQIRTQTSRLGSYFSSYWEKLSAYILKKCNAMSFRPPFRLVLLVMPKVHYPNLAENLKSVRRGYREVFNQVAVFYCYENHPYKLPFINVVSYPNKKPLKQIKLLWGYQKTEMSSQSYQIVFFTPW